MSQNSNPGIGADGATNPNAAGNESTERIFDVEAGLTEDIRATLAADGVDVDAGMRDLKYNLGLWLKSQPEDIDRDVVGTPTTGYYHIPVHSCLTAFIGLFGTFGTFPSHDPLSPAALPGYLCFLNALLTTTHTVHRASMQQAAMCQILADHAQGIRQDQLLTGILSWEAVMPKKGISATELSAQLEHLKTWGIVMEVDGVFRISNERVKVRLPETD